jgi:hypothetical protein
MGRGSIRRTVPQGQMLAPMLAVVVTAMAVASPSMASEAMPTGGAATVVVALQGEPFDLGDDWGDAQACLVWDEAGGVECFRTEEAMDQRIAEIEKELGDGGGGGARASQCSGYVRLYEGISYTGQVLYIHNRLQWINLSAYGFSNETSSFKIGPCSSYLADYDWGGGSWYPTSATQAWDVAWIMASGWNNRVSSIYIQ